MLLLLACAVTVKIIYKYNVPGVEALALACGTRAHVHKYPRVEAPCV